MLRNTRWLCVALAAAAAACTGGQQLESSGRSGGALAASLDDTRLYIADEDNDELVVFDTASEKVASRIKVGRWPEKVVVGSEGLVYVTNRHGRSVSVIDPVAAVEVSRIEVGAEPSGLALTPDGGTLLVSNATSHTMSVIDVASRKVVRSVPTEADPSGVTIAGEGRAYVTHARLGSVSVVDYRGGAVREGFSLALPPEQTFSEKRVPGQPLEPVVTADGRVFVTHVQSKEEPIPTEGSSDGYVSGSPVPVVAAAIVEIDPAENKIIPPSARADGQVKPGCLDCAGMPEFGGGGGAFVTSFSAPVSGPAAAVADARGDWLFIVNQLSNNVSIRSTRGLASPEPVQVGSGPRGIALAKDGRRAWVYNAFDHSVSVLEPRDGVVLATREIVVGRSPLTPEQQLGRHLFFSATDPRMTTGTAAGISCASCHPAGREDGRTWKFSEGPRNTPTLAGRHLATTAPYHWDGLLADMHAFKLVVEERMGGAGTKQASDRGAPVADPLSAADFNAMMAYLDVLPPPDNPFRTEQPSEAVLRGKAVFEGKAACASCHAGADLTDNGFYDVGTMRLDEKFPLKVNTPTLRNIFFSAPYLHDGSIPDLRGRVLTNPGEKHGLTKDLTPGEVDDLVEYLKTL
jgi:YVTN family beta-propeller protein